MTVEGSTESAADTNLLHGAARLVVSAVPAHELDGGPRCFDRSVSMPWVADFVASPDEADFVPAYDDDIPPP